MASAPLGKLAGLLPASLKYWIAGLRRQPRFRILTGAILFILLFGALGGRFSRSQENEVGIPYAGPHVAEESTEGHGFLPMNAAKDLCERRRWEVYLARNQRRKIYDMFLINTELDWLELRLNELDAEVDYFVVLESALTFQADPKSLHLENSLQDARWERFRPKIIHQVVNFTDSNVPPDDSWEHERFQRNALYSQALLSLSGEQKPSQGDVLFVGDIDELPRLSTLGALRNCAFPPRVTLRSQFYYYSFQWLHRGEQWKHPQATYFNGVKTIKPEDLRTGKAHVDVYNAAWHCSSCFSKMAELKTKITSFSHKGYNQPYFLDGNRLLQNVRMGRDLFEREGEIFDRMDSNSDIPEYLRNQEIRKKYEYMIDRDPPNANFLDV